MIDLSALKTEIENDPLGLGYAELLSLPGELLSALNMPRDSIHMPKLVNVLDIQDLLLRTGEMIKIMSSSHPVTKAAMILLSDSRRLTVDVNLPTIQVDMAAMVAAGDLDQSTLDAINALASRPGSRAEQLGMGVVVADNLIGLGVLR